MDLYEFTEPARTTPAAASSSDTPANANSGNTPAASEQPSLNEEVQQALGSLGSWWGGFRKQSSVALTSARKDLGQVVQQAQREIEKLAIQPTSPPTSPRASTSTSAPNAAAAPSDTKDTPASTSEEATTTSGDTTAEPRSTSPTSTTTAPSLFSFIPSTIAQNLSLAPSQLQTTLQRTLANPEIQTLRNNITMNLSSLQSTVSTTVQSSVHSVQSNPQVQNLASSVQSLPTTVGSGIGGLNLNKVEGFMLEKGEEFWKGAGEFFREAVKIVPPSEEELAARGTGGVGVFDGAGVWMFDDLGGADGEVDNAVKGASGDIDGKGKASAGGSAGVAVSRTAALMKQLNGDPALLRADPSEGEAFEWFLRELEGKGVSVGSEAWVGKCAGQEWMFEELRSTKEILVPAEMDEATFWKRYWFRAWQIREAEEKRKALLQATATLQEDGDFTWEDEEDETSSTGQTENPTPLEQSTPTASISVAIPASHPDSTEMKAVESDGKKPGPGASSSPREGSEDSYDLVSTRSGNASGTALALPGLASVLEKEEGGKKGKKDGEDEEGDSGDSDWE